MIRRFILPLVLLPALAYGQDAPEPAKPTPPPTPTQAQTTSAPAPETVASLKATIPLLKKQAKLQAALNKDNLKAQQDNLRLQIFQRESQAKLAAAK
jgi:hypothetical protein